jgi:DNA-binding GntR family transcriptional regulator
MQTSESSNERATAREGKSTSLTDRIYESLRASILSGEYAVGSVLAEGTLAVTFGSSKTPVRHALARLRTDGLLEVGRRRQLIVRGFTAAHREEVLQVREALELIAIRKACSVMTVDDMDQVRVLLRRQRRAAAAHDEEEFLCLDEEFHILIALGANLPIVARLLQQTRGFARIMRLGRTQPPEHLLEVQAEHEEIADALELRDADAAERALRRHLHHWDSLLSAGPSPAI